MPHPLNLFSTNHQIISSFAPSVVLAGQTYGPIIQKNFNFAQRGVCSQANCIMHKGFKCLDVSQGRIYISRDVVFDECVFPFADLHPNAGAQLRSEILLLPETLKNPSDIGGVCTDDSILANSPSSNHAPECTGATDASGSTPRGSGKNSVKIRLISCNFRLLRRVLPARIPKLILVNLRPGNLPRIGCLTPPHERRQANRARLPYALLLRRRVGRPNNFGSIRWNHVAPPRHPHQSRHHLSPRLWL
jgi:hypothetical protein